LGFATIFTLYLIPVFYSLLAGFAKPRAKEAKDLEAELSAASGVMDTHADRAADEGAAR
jgi:HAE1 family hydrophobic/amphiphilic exporter-1